MIDNYPFYKFLEPIIKLVKIQTPKQIVQHSTRFNDQQMNQVILHYFSCC